MKLTRHDSDSYCLDLGPREYRLLLEVLKLYPRIPVVHHRITRDDDMASTRDEQRLLEEALAAHKKETRRKLDVWLKDSHRRREPAGAGQLKLSLAELDWLLQVLNDVRVGSWLRLGCPDHGQDPPPKLTRDRVGDYVAMEYCGLLQSVLLAGLNQ